MKMKNEKLPEENFGSDVSVAHRLFPRRADEIALLRVEESALTAVASIGAAHRRLGGGRHSRSGLNN